jgi:predicted metalloenzyme YecM
MDQVWIVLVAVIAYIDSAPGVGQPGFVNVVCSGNGRKIVESKVRSCLLSYGWQVLQIESALPVDEDAVYDDEIWELIEDVGQNSDHIRLATLHSYRVN